MARRKLPLFPTERGAPPLPAFQMRSMLQEARLMGKGFDEAWAESWQRIRWPHDTEHRVEWKAVLGDRPSALQVGMSAEECARQLGVWKASYYRYPTAPHGDFGRLAAA